MKQYTTPNIADNQRHKESEKEHIKNVFGDQREVSREYNFQKFDDDLFAGIGIRGQKYQRPHWNFLGLLEALGKENYQEKIAEAQCTIIQEISDIEGIRALKKDTSKIQKIKSGELKIGILYDGMLPYMVIVAQQHLSDTEAGKIQERISREVYEQICTQLRESKTHIGL